MSQSHSPNAFSSLGQTADFEMAVGASWSWGRSPAMATGDRTPVSGSRSGGIIYSVHAQDLLESLGALNTDEVRRLNTFHGAIFDLIRQSENVLYAGVGFPYSDCLAPPISRPTPWSACWQPHAF